MRAVHSRRASALIIVLAFIVLIAIMMLSYMASTQSALKKSSSSAAIVETDLLADTAIAAIVDDLRQEMVAGSTNAPTSTDPIMIVTNAWAMVPGRVLSPGLTLTDTNFVNLTKQSVRSNFYPGSNPGSVFSAKGGAGVQGRMRASTINTAQPSINGRFVSAERWNKPRFLPGSGFTSTNQLPNWILISRKGPSPDGSEPSGYNNKESDDYVIGRFAYNIYNVGGLLDINVAGYPSSAEDDARLKGAMAWADITAIPGIPNNSAVQQFIEWRNKLSSGGTSYASMLKNWALPRGFQKSYSTGGDIENRFFNRQDLIKFSESSFGSGIIGTNALPYLTTFSPDVDQPTFRPDPNRPKVVRTAAAGGNDAYGLDDNINVSFLSLKDSDGGLRVRKRFPLERLKYVIPGTTPSSEDGIKIQKYFGLVWDSGSYSWRYDDGSAQAGIKRLSEITDRQPNFVELLKAAIMVGSLGGQYFLDDMSEASGSPRRLGGRDSSVNLHIMKIAAAIIDQYDADSFPTRISFEGEMVCGIEDLPYIYSLRAIGYRQVLINEVDITANPKTPVDAANVPQNTASGRRTPFRYVMMLQPALWNPNKPTSSFMGPENFRISLRGTGVYAASQRGKGNANEDLKWFGSATTWYRNFPGTNPRDLNNAVNFSESNGFLTFTQRPGGVDDLFREPYTLKSPNFPAGSQAAASFPYTYTAPGAVEDIAIDAVEQNDTGNPAELTSRVIGFRMGWVWGGPADTSADGFFGKARTYGDVTVVLQYQAANGQYITYDEMPSVPPIDVIYIDSTNDPQNRRPRLWARIDPRADRFGPRSFLVRNNPLPAYEMYFPQGQSYRPGSIANSRADNGGLGREGFGDSLTSAAVGWTRGSRPETWNTIADNKPNSGGSTVFYADPDGVVRRAMGGYASGLVGAPMAVGRNSGYVSRPIILNRPFRSVAELGYAFRGMPWKQLDFWTPESGDAALLDVFCISENQDKDGNPLSDNDVPVVSGRLNLNTQNSVVLQAMLKGVLKADGEILDQSQAKAIADSLVEWVSSSQSGKGPFRNRAEIVGKYDAVSSTKFSGFSSQLESMLSGTDRAVQVRRQSIMRALVDSSTTRTWSFVIDVIVQKGKYPAASTGFEKFSVEGEQRFWVHLALDRLTGKIIFEKIEAVNE